MILKSFKKGRSEMSDPATTHQTLAVLDSSTINRVLETKKFKIDKFNLLRKSN
jgi:hypothetical protein